MSFWLDSRPLNGRGQGGSGERLPQGRLMRTLGGIRRENEKKKKEKKKKRRRQSRRADATCVAGAYFNITGRIANATFAAFAQSERAGLAVGDVGATLLRSPGKKVPVANGYRSIRLVARTSCVGTGIDDCSAV